MTPIRSNKELGTFLFPLFRGLSPPVFDALPLSWLGFFLLLAVAGDISVPTRLFYTQAPSSPYKLKIPSIERTLSYPFI